ncbi:MAG TPA: winged helix DNA-binding domain-containing protein [Kofleriaceae bacterium]|nr:winged helix DNA-binding domain-containing protein [Kofleriaceae bacterium]
MGAIQAQEYAGALWAVGLRTRGETLATIEGALAAGTIVRTHPMRGTHHFVAREDVRWLIALMGPLMIKRNERRNRELKLDEKTLTKALTTLERALAGGNHLTRAETVAVLERAKIATDGQRIAHIIYRAELEGLVCSGVRKGKQITIALLDERTPKAKPRSREDALRELATRYFTTRGPATRADFTWWCQLPAADAREAMELAKLDGDGSYFTKGTARRAKPPRAFLLPPYDEYTVAYRDRSAAGSPPAKAATFGESALLAPSVVVDGIVIGSWRREKNRIATKLWSKLPRKDTDAVEDAVRRYVAFVS